jgi:hypothetical protein
VSENTDVDARQAEQLFLWGLNSDELDHDSRARTFWMKSAQAGNVSAMICLAWKLRGTTESLELFAKAQSRVNEISISPGFPNETPTTRAPPPTAPSAVRAEIDRCLLQGLSRSRAGAAREAELLFARVLILTVAGYAQRDSFQILLHREMNPRERKSPLEEHNEAKARRGQKMELGCGWSDLHVAANAGSLAIVRVLVEQRRADPHLRDSSGRHALHRAAENTCPGILKFLIEDCHCDPLILEEHSSSGGGLAFLQSTRPKWRFKTLDYLLHETLCDAPPSLECPAEYVLVRPLRLDLYWVLASSPA